MIERPEQPDLKIIRGKSDYVRGYIYGEYDMHDADTEWLKEAVPSEQQILEELLLNDRVGFTLEQQAQAIRKLLEERLLGEDTP
jgi:hypothetical protein